MALDLAGAQEQWLMLTAHLEGRAQAKFWDYNLRSNLITGHDLYMPSLETTQKETNQILSKPTRTLS